MAKLAMGVKEYKCSNCKAKEILIDALYGEPIICPNCFNKELTYIRG